jgi:signal transduction histidine kinase
LQQKLISLDDFLKDLLADWNFIFRENKVEIKYKIALNLPLVRVDADKLWRVFENLISNAINYNKQKFTLTISANHQDNMIWCEVADNGIGINEQQLENLFDIYTRGTKVKGKISLGLGLYLCRQIINAHGGEIGVKSELGNGTSFWFTLPLK